MKKKMLRPLWLRKRIMFPLAFIIGLSLAALVAFIRSDVTTIVIYNETGDTLPPVLVQACGQSKTFTRLGDQDSVRFKLKPQGPGGPIRLEIATDPAWIWTGAPVQSHGGYRVTIRLEPSQEVEAYADFSWWRRTFQNK
jgi:hypothetical protein